MFDPNKLKLQDKGRGNSVYFEKAYWLVMEQVDAPAEWVNALLPLLYDSFEAGLPVKQLHYIEQYLPDDQWRWSEYERQWPEMKRREYERIKAHISAVTDIKIAGNIAGYAALRKIAQELLGDKVPVIKKMAEAEDLCEKLKIQGHEIKALELFKQAALDRNEKQFNNNKLELPSQREMLIHRIFRLVSGIWQCQHINEASKSFPYLLLSVSDPSRAKPECVENDGKPYRLDSEFWKRGMPPCERIDCICSVIQMNEKMLQKRGLKIFDKI